MASEKILQVKNEIVQEITDSIKKSESIILFSYQGLTVSMMSDLRTKLRETGASVKIYKNSLTKRALSALKIDLDEFMLGPNAVVFSENLLEPIKVISDYAKENNKLEIRVGIISGQVANLDTIKEYANIPSREGLLTMLAGGMIQYVKELSIGLNLYAVSLNDGKPLDEPEATKEKPTVAEEQPVQITEEAAIQDETPKEETPQENTEEPTIEEQSEEN